MQASSGIAQQQLKELRQQIAAIEATVGTTYNTLVPMYSKNLVTLFPILSSPYVTNTVANYFLWYQLVKMVLEGRQKFDFLTGKIPHPPLGNLQE